MASNIDSLHNVASNIDSLLNVASNIASLINVASNIVGGCLTTKAASVPNYVTVCDRHDSSKWNLQKEWVPSRLHSKKFKSGKTKCCGHSALILPAVHAGSHHKYTLPLYNACLYTAPLYNTCLYNVRLHTVYICVLLVSLLCSQQKVWQPHCLDLTVRFDSHQL